ncbi:YqzL family protein [Thermoflavimicrobium dichotomicum]|nr:YqzL family protein [Thermoflavimicrobium dichotomicum]
MRNFIWSCFEVTGSIEAYLLYKDMEALERKNSQEGFDEEEEQK